MKTKITMFFLIALFSCKKNDLAEFVPSSLSSEEIEVNIKGIVTDNMGNSISNAKLTLNNHEVFSDKMEFSFSKI